MACGRRPRAQAADGHSSERTGAGRGHRVNPHRVPARCPWQLTCARMCRLPVPMWPPTTTSMSPHVPPACYGQRLTCAPLWRPSGPLCTCVEISIVLDGLNRLNLLAACLLHAACHTSWAERPYGYLSWPWSLLWCPRKRLVSVSIKCPARCCMHLDHLN